MPGNEWLSWQANDLRYTSSLQGDEMQFMRLAFTPLREKRYPLVWYRDQLKYNVPGKNWGQLPYAIGPLRFRYWWEITLTSQNKQTAGSGLFLLFFMLAFFTWWWQRQRFDALALAKAFFPASGMATVKEINDRQLKLGGQEKAMALRWSVESLGLPESLHETSKIYLLLDRNQTPPGAQILSELSEQHGHTPVIPLSAEIMELAIRNGDEGRRLQELEQLYLSRTDPYLEKGPIDFRQFFYGRGASIDDLLHMLGQCQHVGVFGLRKVGKTSLIKQVQQRFTQSPLVFLDCQSLSARASVYYQHLVERFAAELRSLKVKKAPKVPREFTQQTTQAYLQAAINCWRKNGRSEPLVIIFDEIDRLFPERSVHNSLVTLGEYVPLFQLLRGIAQTTKLLSLLVVAYRPNINRHNRLDASLPENPMYSAFKEHYLGFLSADECKAMIIGIGALKKINWTDEAADRVFYYCAGHPLVSRLFASEVCEEGALKEIDLAVVEDAAVLMAKNLRRNEIGNYFKESVWPELDESEKQMIRRIVQGELPDLDNLNDADDAAISALLNLGLISDVDQQFFVCGELLRVWLLKNTPKIKGNLNSYMKYAE